MEDTQDLIAECSVLPSKNLILYFSSESSVFFSYANMPQTVETTVFTK